MLCIPPPPAYLLQLLNMSLRKGQTGPDLGRRRLGLAGAGGAQEPGRGLGQGGADKARVPAAQGMLLARVLQRNDQKVAGEWNLNRFRVFNIFYFHYKRCFIQYSLHTHKRSHAQGQEISIRGIRGGIGRRGVEKSLKLKELPRGGEYQDYQQRVLKKNLNIN